VEFCFIFIKPSFNTLKTVTYIENLLEKNQISIASKGKISGMEMMRKSILEAQYCTSYNFATKVDPVDINLTEIDMQRFNDHFMADWYDLLTSSQLYNAKDSCEYLGIDIGELGRMCSHTCALQFKFKRGLYCARIDQACCESVAIKSRLEGPMYIINYHYGVLEELYRDPTTVINYMLVEWDKDVISWPDFHQNIIGDEDLQTAKSTSIRGIIKKEWKNLMCKLPPTNHNNVLHASKSAFEALKERVLWYGNNSIFNDILGGRLVASKITVSNIQHWFSNPIVNNLSVFDHMYHLDSDRCIEIASILVTETKSSKQKLISRLKTDTKGGRLPALAPEVKSHMQRKVKLKKIKLKDEKIKAVKEKRKKTRND